MIKFIFDPVLSISENAASSVGSVWSDGGMRVRLWRTPVDKALYGQTWKHLDMILDDEIRQLTEYDSPPRNLMRNRNYNNKSLKKGGRKLFTVINVTRSGSSLQGHTADRSIGKVSSLVPYSQKYFYNETYEHTRWLTIEPSRKSIPVRLVFRTPVTTAFA